MSTLNWLLDIDDCSSTPCKNDGVCVDGVNEYNCSCAHGFIGADCSISTRTLNHSYIIIVNNRLSIFKWLFYFIDIDDCMEKPCNNGGVCQDGIASYTCDCPIGFIGLDCETSMLIQK